MKNDKFRPSVRYINGIRIYFKHKTIIQVTQRGYSVSIIRWDKPGGGTYSKSWRPLCRILTQRNDLDSIYQICSLAEKHDLIVISCRHPEDPTEDVWVRPSKYLWHKAKD